jgi:DUF2971 family protein
MLRGLDSSSSPDLREMVKLIQAEAVLFTDQWDKIDCEEIFHYTSLDIAYKILGGRQLWVSDLFSMNDTTEFKYAIGLIDEVLMSRWNMLPIAVAEDFRPSKLLALSQTSGAFAGCFSSDGDLLSQWRAYPPGSNAQGVSIGFRITELGKTAWQSPGYSQLPSFSIVKINYYSEDLRNAARRICDAALDLAASRCLIYEETNVFWDKVLLLLFGFALRFKNPSYADEREWRVLKLEPDKAVHQNREGKEVKFRCLNFSPKAITKINVGPRAAPETEEQLRRFLADNGLERVKVDRSAIPFR